MKNVRYDRLQHLADWLEQPQERLGHTFYTERWWHFSNLDGRYDPAPGYAGLERGTYGGAIGELPFAFPNDFEMRLGPGIYYPYLRSFRQSEVTPNPSPWYTIPQFFSIEKDAAQHLFAPSSEDAGHFQSPEMFGGQTLSEGSPKEVVASNLRMFCHMMFVAERVPA